MKLLVVEDNARLSDRIQQHLRPLHVIDVAESGHEALELASNLEYELIILDLGLPDMSGLEVCKQLRKDGDTPILILTGDDDAKSRVALLDNCAVNIEPDSVTFASISYQFRFDHFSRNIEVGYFAGKNCHYSRPSTSGLPPSALFCINN